MLKKIILLIGVSVFSNAVEIPQIIIDKTKQNNIKILDEDIRMFKELKYKQIEGYVTIKEKEKKCIKNAETIREINKCKIPHSKLKVLMKSI